MSDHDIEGQFELLLGIWTGDAWADLWQDMAVNVYTFADLGLASDAADATVWACCQANEVVLITGNRNDDGPTSLESTIRRCGRDTSLPVITIARPAQVLIERRYAERTAEAILDLLLNLDKLRGVGRLFAP
jgi:hypothetical protein